MEGLRRLLLEERLVGYLDPGMEDVLARLNSTGWFSTTSSCSGRITVIEGYWPWERRETTRIVFKSHKPVDASLVALVMARGFDNLWLKVTGPIIHARIPVSCARAVLEVARSSGFKHSGLISIDETEAVVELVSAVSLTAPLILSGRFLVAGEALEAIVARANEALTEGWKRLRRLADSIPSAGCGTL